jgi:hypothetical protein
VDDDGHFAISVAAVHVLDDLIDVIGFDDTPLSGSLIDLIDPLILAVMMSLYSKASWQPSITQSSRVRLWQ